MQAPIQDFKGKIKENQGKSRKNQDFGKMHILFATHPLFYYYSTLLNLIHLFFLVEYLVNFAPF